MSLSNMTADVTVGLALDDDAFSFINPGIDFTHDEVLVKVRYFYAYLLKKIILMATKLQL